MEEHTLSYLLVDGENLDATLGNCILGGTRPAPEQRPRWERVREFTARHFGADCKALFFLNASSGTLPASFVQALMAMDYKPVPVSGAPDEKVVDMAIMKTLEALQTRPGHVMLGSHDADFVPGLKPLLGGTRRVGILGFSEYVSTLLREMEVDGLEIVDLEHDVSAFNVQLPRLRIIPIAEFDPAEFL